MTQWSHIYGGIGGSHTASVYLSLRQVQEAKGEAGPRLGVRRPTAMCIFLTHSLLPIPKWPAAQYTDKAQLRTTAAAKSFGELQGSGTWLSRLGSLFGPNSPSCSTLETLTVI